MDQDLKIKRPLNPQENANILSKLTFSYTLPTLFKSISKKVLLEEDIPHIIDSHAACVLGHRLEKSWTYQKAKKKPLLWIAICKTFGLEFVLLGLIVFCDQIILRILRSLSLVELLKHFEKSDGEKNDAYMYGGLIIAVSVINIFVGQWALKLLLLLAMKMRVACSSLVYRKAIKLSTSVLAEVGVGHITNLLSNDLGRFDSAIVFIHYFWIAPLQVVEVLLVLNGLVGITSAIGIASMVMWFPILVYLGRKCSEIRLRTATKTDVRVQLMNEIISGIKVIKLYAWEKPFTKLVESARSEEVQQIQAINNVRGLMKLILAIPKNAIFVTVLTYVLTGNNLTAVYIFAIMVFYDNVRITFIYQCVHALQLFSELLVSIKRVEKLLLFEEKMSIAPIETDKPYVLLNNVTARWSKTDVTPTLCNVSLNVYTNQCLAIVGPVGSGKSSIFQVVMGELPIEYGLAEVHGSISYASQEPWIFSGSIRQNVLFGEAMDTERYKNTLRVCALEHDLAAFPYSDQTLIGEKGVTLSGGQKSRISLARAIYRKADIYLLDDPFSAVDIHVGNHIFQECVKGVLLEKCVIVITHNLQLLHSFNCICIIKSGTIAESGTFEELSKSDFLKQLEMVTKEDNEVSSHGLRKMTMVENHTLPQKLHEHRSVGVISNDIYWSYFKSGGSSTLCVCVAVLYILVTFCYGGVDFFSAYWVNQKYQHDWYLYIYAALTALLILTTLFRTFAHFNMTSKISINIHSNMFKKVLNSTMFFFHSNSSGRILNRFSKDLGIVDETIPINLMDVLQNALFAVGCVVMICITNPWLILVTLLLSAIFYYVRVFYLTTSQNLTRFDGTARSPIYGHVNETLQGIVTVRAYNTQLILQDEFDKHLDFHSSVYSHYIDCSRVFAFYVDLVCVLYASSVVMSILFTEKEQYAGNVGLAVSQAFGLTGMLQWVLLLSTDLENKMTSVERVLEYTKNEQDDDQEGSQPPPPNWPTNGSIEFKSLFMRYVDGEPYVLKNVSFVVDPADKIGIVGRTGAGKSSLTTALFQLAKTEGALYIDDTDVTQITKRSLRERISIIPQDPILFSGSLRRNLDPFVLYPDTELWSALDDVQLKETVSKLSLGLDHVVSNDGANFSIGQRQLICLARAILRKNIILVLDEATANVDPHTDAVIQSTVKRKFANCTVLTIAHRINTIMDYDKVLVMDSGEIAEYDHPHILLQNKEGRLYSMLQKLGSSMTKYLSDIAEQSYKNKRQIELQ